MSPTKILVVSHTHWDREWYHSFQQFRARLVEMMDALLALLERESRFASFTLDGQTVLLEDYLEVRPEKRAELRERVQEERLLIGPWYTSPDEFLVSAEALIRNLMLGHRFAAEFGRAMEVGYLPDSFGHTAQLPQILRGFGIGAAVFWRGVGDKPGQTEFRWKGPDGSTVLAVHLPEGYGNGADLPAEREGLLERLTEVREQLAAGATADHLLLMNGGDHKWPQENLPQVLDLANEALEDATLVQSTLPDYVAAIEQADPPLPAVEGEQRCAKHAYLLPGTLSSRMPLKQRNRAVQTLLEKWAEPFSAFAELINQETGKLVDGKPPANLPIYQSTSPLIWQAWKYLLQNQAHDSICGCNIDDVQRDMEVRFAWAKEIGEEVVRQSLRTIAGHIDTTAPAEALTPIVVFNPLGVPRSDVVTVSFQPLTSLKEGTFAITDSDGRTVPHEMLSGEPTQIFAADASPEEFTEFMQMIEGGEVFDLRITSLNLYPQEAGTLGVSATLVKKEAAPQVDFGAIKRRMEAALEPEEGETWHRFSVKAYFAPQVQISFRAENVPACGYKTYTIQSLISNPQSPTPTIENNYFRIEANSTDGTLTITDKETGLIYPDCNRFVDEGEAGDLYWHETPARDEVVDGPAEPPQITLSQGPLGATLRVEMTYSLPAGLCEDRTARSEQRVSCPIVSEIRLRPGTRRIDVRTEVENRAGNHRLRVCFPTPIETDRSCAEGAFGTVERPVEIPSGEGWVERPVGRHPQASFVVASDGTKGLLVVNRGLTEYEFLPSASLPSAALGTGRADPGESGLTIALTLLRCVDRLSRGAEVLTPLAQCQGRQVFEYALLPHGGDWREAALYHEAHACNAPLKGLVTDVHKGRLPTEQSFASVEPTSLVVSAVKVAEAGDGLILRLYNPTRREVEGKVHLWRPFAQAHLVRLDEEKVRPLAHQPDDVVMIRVNQNEAVTIRFSFEEE
ncbi:MAG: glycoside hydrolase family 38 C-terminal domain-containing protein [Chloroflexota bacterium]|nr:glycoside hydrolase family 38 C-terminal domain-containing protein [Chloroflexota bacterium]